MDACAGYEVLEFGTMTIRLLPLDLVSLTLEFTQTEGRIREYGEDGAVEAETIFILSAPPTGKGTAYTATLYIRERYDSAEWNEWVILEVEWTEEALAEALPTADFCGLTSDQLTNIQYVGVETVDGMDTRHYSALFEGNAWDMWIGPDGPVRADIVYDNVSSDDGIESITVVHTISKERPDAITAPVTPGVTPIPITVVPGATPAPIELTPTPLAGDQPGA